MTKTGSSCGLRRGLAQGVVCSPTNCANAEVFSKTPEKTPEKIKILSDFILAHSFSNWNKNIPDDKFFCFVDNRDRKDYHNIV